MVALLDAYRRSDVGRNHSGRSLGSDAVGHLVECVPWWLCLMLADVQTWAQPFGAVVARCGRGILSSGCRGSVVLRSDAYRRSDVGHDHSGAVALLRSGILASVCRGGSARCLQTFGRGAQSFGAVAWL